MKSKSNPIGIRKGDWVKAKYWGSKVDAYKVSRVSEGFFWIIYRDREFDNPYSINSDVKKVKKGEKNIRRVTGLIKM